MVNVELARQTLQAIRDHEDRWNQRQFVELKDETSPECGTTLCFAGFAACLTGAEFVPPEVYFDDTENGTKYWYQPNTVITPEGDTVGVESYAMDVLGLNYGQANTIFYNFTDDVDELASVVEQVIAEGPNEVEEAVTE